MERYIKENVIKKRCEIIITTQNDGIYAQTFNPSHELLLENGWIPYEYTPIYIEIPLEQQYREKIIELIRLQYSIDDELAILRQRDTKPQEFEIYNDYVENCKQQAYNEIYGK